MSNQLSVLKEGTTYNNVINNFKRTEIILTISVNDGFTTQQKEVINYYPAISSYSYQPQNYQLQPFNVWNAQETKKMQALNIIEGIDTITFNWNKIVDLPFSFEPTTIRIIYENELGEEMQKEFRDLILDPSGSVNIGQNSSARYILQKNYK